MGLWEMGVTGGAMVLAVLAVRKIFQNKLPGMTGLLVGMVSVIPAIAMYKDMDEKGKVVNGAFLVSAASMLAAHAGFTLSREPELLGAMLGAKLGGGAAAFILAMLVFCADKRKQ